MGRQPKMTRAAMVHVNHQRAVDAVEQSRILSYRTTSSFLRSFAATVDEAARRADALHRLDIALGYVRT